ncbi:MAG: lysophospholipid acyltransferase family protein [Polyangiaceae bacterium]
MATTRTFVEYAHCLAESLASGRREARAARCSFKEPSLPAALSASHGIVVVTAHAGAWDAAAPLLARDFARPVTVVMRPEVGRGARKIHDGVRRRAGVQIVHVGCDATDPLPLLSSLRSGGVVAFQLDRVPPGVRSLKVPLFGRTAAVPEGPFRMAALARVPVLPLFVRRVAAFDYEIWGGPLLRLERRASQGELSAVAARAVWELERFIRAHPSQWFCFESAPEAGAPFQAERQPSAADVSHPRRAP